MEEESKSYIELGSYGYKYRVEFPYSDITADKYKEAFSKLLVQAGFSPEVIEPAEGGRYECAYLEDDQL